MLSKHSGEIKVPAQEVGRNLADEVTFEPGLPWVGIWQIRRDHGGRLGRRAFLWVTCIDML